MPSLEEIKQSFMEWWTNGRRPPMTNPQDAAQLAWITGYGRGRMDKSIEILEALTREYASKFEREGVPDGSQEAGT